jgi:hypothetical protein
MKTQPTFKHDCKSCQFLGNYYGDDVYYCPGSSDVLGTILARHGDDPANYASTLLSSLQAAMSDPDYRIALAMENQGGRTKTMAYRDWVFSPDCIPYVKAMIAAVFANCHNITYQKGKSNE